MSYCEQAHECPCPEGVCTHCQRQCGCEHTRCECGELLEDPKKVECAACRSAGIVDYLSDLAKEQGWA